VIAATPLLAHHSFAMYDTANEARKTMTGKLVRFVIGANHSQYIMEILKDDGSAVMDPKDASKNYLVANVDDKKFHLCCLQKDKTEHFAFDCFFSTESGVRFNAISSRTARSTSSACLAAMVMTPNVGRRGRPLGGGPA